MTIRRLFCAFPLSLLPLSALGQAVPLEPVVVTALRSEQSAATSAFAAQTLSGARLESTPSLTLDSALRSIPSFSLFRRSDSLTAHPTAQGVSLRGLGPSGASRSLVLLDGVPLNDPFGGWIAWSKLPREGLARAEVIPGGGSTAWGNAALGGVLQLLTEAPETTGGRITGLVGDFETRSVEWNARAVGRGGALQVSGRVFSTDGFRTLAPEDRGPIDTPAGQRHRWVSARWVHEIAPGTTARVTGRWFREKRANGTPHQRNDSEEFFLSAEVMSRKSDRFGWTALAYGQDQTFASTFSAVAAGRASETPASDQYDVPARAFGAAWIGEWGAADGARTVAGLDARRVDGESRERFTFMNGAFTRHRAAGGHQGSAGVWVLHEREFRPDLRAVVGSRVDFWREGGGFRAERQIATGESLRDEHFADRDGTEWSPSAGLHGRINERLSWRLSGQHAFRRPTLNELYRPFRVGNVITEANPTLRTETVTTIEAALRYARGGFSVEVTPFWNAFRDAVGNVTVAHGPGNVPGFGFIPAGGLGRRRENLDAVRVRGVELAAAWRATETVTLTAAVLGNDAEVTKSAIAPGLVGKRVAQVPKFSGAFGLEWRASGWTLAPRLRWLGAQYEDDENELRLAPAAVVDVFLSRAWGEQVDVFVTVENLFNERIETGRSGAGLINVGTPRFASGGVRWKW